jgi:type II secretory pathway component GspD/PulD (secretin)
MGFQFSILEGIGFLDPTATSPHGATLDITGGGVSFGDFTPGEIDAGLGQAQTDLFGSFEPGGLNIGYFTGRVGAFLRALDDLTDVEILATPKIITLNKQRGEVMLGRRDGFITSVTTQTITTQRIEYLETGTRLIYRPFIASDGLIRLEIHPEDSDGGLTEDGLPFKNTAELTTNVMVRDGETVVIGGLFRTRDIEDVKQVPYLGDVPLLGALFRGSVHTTIREEIIVMLTPHVLRSGDEEAAPLAEERTDPAFGLLSDTWLRTGQQLLAANQAASAWLLFSAAHGLESEAAEQLREQALRSMVDPSPTALVDGLIDPMHFQVPQR